MNKVIFAIGLCSALATTGFSFAAVQEQAKPAAIASEGDIDVMWNILPDEIVTTQFGGKVKSKYYGVEVVIANSGKALLLVEGIGFKPNDAGKSLQWVPITSRRFLQPLTNKEQTIRLCNTTFDEFLLIRPNSQVRTMVFVQRALLEFQPPTGTSGSASRERLGGVIITGKQIAAADSVRIHK
jgi:hypothetical protein